MHLSNKSEFIVDEFQLDTLRSKQSLRRSHESLRQDSQDDDSKKKGKRAFIPIQGQLLIDEIN